MVDGVLKAYVDNALQNGYTVEAIRSALYAQGYKQQQIDEILAASMRPTHHHFSVETITGHPALVVVLILIVVTLLAVGSASLLFFDSDGTVPTNAQVTRPQTSTPTQIPTTPPSTGQQEQSASSSNANSGSSNQQTNTQTSSQANSQQSGSSQPPSSQSQGTQQFELPRALQIEQEVRELAQNYPEEAAQLCIQLQSQSGKDACYARVAKIAKTPFYCETIKSNPVRDNCYVGFAIDNIGDVSLCEKITQSTLKSSCKKLYAASSAIPLTEQDLIDSYTDTTYS